MKNILIDYFNGTLKPEEETAVQEWLSDNAHRKDIEDILDSLFETSIPDRNLDAEVAYSAISDKLHINKSRKKTIWRTATLSAAAAILAVAISIPFAYKSGSDAKYQEMSSIEWIETNVPYGQNRSLELSDGTVLDLRPGTKIIYPSVFSGTERKVFIEGEVYAKVTKNPECPFVISSKDSEVRVFGTTFNFKSYDDLNNVELMLFDGSVSFVIDSEKLSKSIKMQPGHVAQYDRCTGRVEVSEFNKGVYRALCDDNALFYYNLTITDIARDLELRFDSKIVITNEALANSRIFAMFTNNESLDEILTAIGAGRKMSIKHSNNTIYLNSNSNVKN